MRSRRGWVFIDIVMALILVAIVGTMLATATQWHNRALAHLSDSRSATRIAESALISMQSGKAPASDSAITIKQLPTPSTISGQIWVEVDAICNNRRASLIGLVPRNSVPGGS